MTQTTVSLHVVSGSLDGRDEPHRYHVVVHDAERVWDRRINAEVTSEGLRMELSFDTLEEAQKEFSKHIQGHKS